MDRRQGGLCFKRSLFSTDFAFQNISEKDEDIQRREDLISFLIIVKDKSCLLCLDNISIIPLEEIEK